MKLAISNIAWKKEEEEKIMSIMQGMNIKGVEIALGKISSDPFSLSKKEVMDYKDSWKDKGIEIVAMQALLYGRPDLTIFDSEDTRLKTLEYLKKVISIGSLLNVKALVFGSPKNRNRKKLSLTEADDIAIPFFREIGKFAGGKGVKFCIEHNPKEYGSDYIETALDALELVKRVNNKGFGLHIDTGGLILSGDSAETIIKCRDFISHFHISQPFLSCVAEADKKLHQSFADALRKISYQGWVSVEMKQPAPEESNIPIIKETLEFVREIYY